MRVEKEHGWISDILFFFLFSFFLFFFFDCDVGCLGIPGSDRSMFLER